MIGLVSFVIIFELGMLFKKMWVLTEVICNILGVHTIRLFYYKRTHRAINPVHKMSNELRLDTHPSFFLLSRDVLEPLSRLRIRWPLHPLQQHRMTIALQTIWQPPTTHIDLALAIARDRAGMPEATTAAISASAASQSLAGCHARKLATRYDLAGVSR